LPGGVEVYLDVEPLFSPIIARSKHSNIRQFKFCTSSTLTTTQIHPWSKSGVNKLIEIKKKLSSRRAKIVSLRLLPFGTNNKWLKM